MTVFKYTYVYMFKAVTCVLSNQEKSDGKWQRLFNLSATPAYVTFPFGPPRLAHGKEPGWSEKSITCLPQIPSITSDVKRFYFLASQSEKTWFLPASPFRRFFPQISVLQVSLEVMSTLLQTFLVLLGWYPDPFLGLAIFGVCFCYFFPWI